MDQDDGDGDDDGLETEGECLEEQGAMSNLETKVRDTKSEMESADSLDGIRTVDVAGEVSWDGDVAAFAFGRGGVVNKDEERREKRGLRGRMIGLEKGRL